MRLIDIDRYVNAHGYRPLKDWETPVYMAQCKTGAIAGDIARDHRSAVRFDGMSGLMAMMQRPPFCLRILREHRTAATQAFRDSVAREMRRVRNAIPN